MRFCFIVEEQYRNDAMPLVIADQLLQWGHDVDVLEPQSAATCLTDLAEQGYDAYVLKSLADGPGMSILEAAESVGIPTINNSRAIRLVRDKAVAAAFARANGLPIPETYFVSHPRLLHQIPLEEYPIVVKPSNGSSCKGIYLLRNPEDVTALAMEEESESFFLAQHYAENSGFDIKVYVTGQEVYAAVAKTSPLDSKARLEVVAYELWFPAYHWEALSQRAQELPLDSPDFVSTVRADEDLCPRVPSQTARPRVTIAPP